MPKVVAESGHWLKTLSLKSSALHCCVQSLLLVSPERAATVGVKHRKSASKGGWSVEVTSKVSIIGSTIAVAPAFGTRCLVHNRNLTLGDTWQP